MLAHPAKLWLINTDLDAANGYGTKMSPRNHSVSLVESQHHIIDPTNSRRALDDGVEDRLHVGRRAADDAEHLGGRRLMLQRLAQFRIAFLEFLEQANVFDSDNRLSGEGFKQLDLFVRKGSDFHASNENSSNRNTFTKQRNGESRPARLTPLVPALSISGNSVSALASSRGCESFADQQQHDRLVVPRVMA